MTNHLYYGDNLEILRSHIKDESGDLVYLDPPFNSQATYNVLFKSPSGQQSQAQIEAFEDTWHWNERAESAFDEVMHGQNADAAAMLYAMRSFLKENDMMAYLTMMTVRLIALGVTSPQDRDAIKAWVDGNADRDKARAVYDSLAQFGVGEGLVWAPDHGLLERVRFPPIRTLDTSKTPKAGEARVAAPVLAAAEITSAPSRSSRHRTAPRDHRGGGQARAGQVS